MTIGLALAIIGTALLIGVVLVIAAFTVWLRRPFSHLQERTPEQIQRVRELQRTAIDLHAPRSTREWL